VRTLNADEVDAILHAEPRGCAMCSLAHPDAPRLAKSRHATCVLDRFAVRRGHLLVVVDRHVENVAELAADEWLDVQRLAWEATRALETALRPVRTYVAALGSTTALGRTFPHVHVHVIPIYDGGEGDRPSEVFTWKNGVVVYDEAEERALAEDIRAAWPS